MRIMPPPWKKDVMHDEAMSRCVIIAVGSMAFSPARFSQNMKMTARTTLPQRRPMTVAEFQAYTVPPHCKASSSKTQAGARNTKPIRSRPLTRDLKVQSVLRFWFPVKGMKKRIAAVRAVAGRLI